MSRPGIELPLAERQAHIMSLLRANTKGMRIAEIAKAIKLGTCRTGEVLRTLRKEGLLATSANGGAAVIWTTPDRAATVRRLIRGRRRARELVRERRLAKERQQEAEAREWLRVNQCIVKAAKAAPIQITGPISVFHLAGHYQGDIHA